MVEYPEHEKLITAKEKYRPEEIAAFKDFMGEHGVRFCLLGRAGYRNGERVYEWLPIETGDFDDLLAEYMDIDLDKIAIEKEMMYQELRRAAAARHE